MCVVCVSVCGTCVEVRGQFEDSVLFYLNVGSGELNSGCHVYLMGHLVSPTVAKFNKAIMLLLNFVHLSSIYGKWCWFSIVLSSFSLKYVSLSTDWISGLSGGAAERSALGKACRAEEQHHHCLPLPL